MADETPETLEPQTEVVTPVEEEAPAKPRKRKASKKARAAEPSGPSAEELLREALPQISRLRLKQRIEQFLNA